ncbi:hypothetical protein FRC00_012437, partial [Tulasnella sp. 408]
MSAVLSRQALTSSTPLKAGMELSNGYAKGPPPGSQYTALFLNRVIVGKEHIWGVVKKGKDVSARALKAPPDGCDS